MPGKKLSGKEISALLRHGAYGALQAGDDAAKFCEEDIDSILERSSKVRTRRLATALSDPAGPRWDPPL